MKTLLIFLSTIFLLSCGSNVYVEKVDDDILARYKTFDWAYDSEEQKPTLNDIQITNLKKEVYAVLAEKGMRHDSIKPDVVIKADVLIERAIRERSDAVYSQPYSRTFYNRYSGRIVNVYYPSQFLGYDQNQYQVKEGTLTLSFFDSQTEKMVWQGWTVTNIGSNFTSSQLMSAARKILKKFS